MQSQQVFVDANAPTIRKKIKKLSKQEPYESRVVWRDLTEAIARDDSEAAGEAKHTVRPSYTCTQYSLKRKFENICRLFGLKRSHINVLLQNV